MTDLEAADPRRFADPDAQKNASAPGVSPFRRDGDDRFVRRWWRVENPGRGLLWVRFTSARFDQSTGETVFEGVTQAQPIANYPRTVTAYVYAKTRDEAGGDIFLGSVLADGNGKFTLRYRGGMTGKYVDAMYFQLTDFGDGIAPGSRQSSDRVRGCSPVFVRQS